MARYAEDPFSFGREFLDQAWVPQQVQVVEAFVANRKLVLPSGHTVGKTFIVAFLALWFYSVFDPSIVLTTAPVWESVYELLWRELSSQAKKAKGPIPGHFASFWKGFPTRIQHHEHHFARGHNSATSEGFQGRHEERLLIILDEAPGVPAHIWDACNSMLQSPLAKIVAIGNPLENTGPFIEATRDPTWTTVRLSALDHPNILAELEGREPPIPAAVRLIWIEEMIEKHCLRTDTRGGDVFEFPLGSGNLYEPDDTFRPRVLGLPPKQSSRAIWSEEWLDQARARELTPEMPLEVGLDIARYGDDKTVFFWRLGPCIMGVWRRTKQSLTDTTADAVELLTQLSNSYGVPAKLIPIKIDDTGLGGGVTDNLRAEEYRVTPINAGSRASDPGVYVNKRAELWFIGRDHGEAGALDLTRLTEGDYNQLRTDLLAPNWRGDARGRRIVESKDEIKKRLKRSTDDGDSFNLCLHPAYGSDGLPVVTKSGQLVAESTQYRREMEQFEQAGERPGTGIPGMGGSATEDLGGNPLGGVSGRFKRRKR